MTALSGLWRLARPRGMVLVLALPALGYGFAHWEHGLPIRDPTGFLTVLAAWWFLSAATLWLNAALDRDAGEVLMGASSIEPAPAGLWAWGYAGLGSAVALGSFAGLVPGACALACAGLAIGYSDPRTAWKGHPVLGPAVNLAGYGVASPMAGFALVGVAPTLRTGLGELLVLGWIGATYFGAQAFQQAEDARRGYRTLVVTHGPRVTLGATRALYGFAIGGLIVGGIAGLFPHLVVLALIPWWWLDRHLAAWADHPSLGVGAARGMLRRATFLAAWVMASVTADHVWRATHGLPPAGLGTAWQPRR